MLHVGTDEAGYGPLLGPLVVAAAVFECDHSRAGIRLPGVGDSKRVYARGGRDALARVLGSYLPLPAPGPQGASGASLGALLRNASVRADPRGAYAWYGDVEDPSLRPAEAPQGFKRLLLNPVCEREFNEGCRTRGGKAHLLFAETMRLVREALALAPEADAEVVCDKHGGRHFYAALLLAELGPSTIVAEAEGPASSRYRLTSGGRRVRIRFEAKADALDPLAGLASIGAKYLRELFMEALNRFFAGRLAGLRPTAGYVEDGRRFLADLGPLLSQVEGYDRGFERLY